MADFIKTNIGQGIDILSVPSNHFKTNEIALSLLMPLSAETASLNAIVPMLLCRSSKEYSTITELNTRLAYLYGAALVPSVSKVGEAQLLRLGITCVDDRFSLDSEAISKSCISLLLSLLFEPKLDDNGLFFEEDVEREKRILTQRIESEENEKRTYVLRKTEEAMFKGEPYAIGRFGSKKTVAAITREAAAAQWKNIIKTARVLLTVVGNANPLDYADELKARFGNAQRAYTPVPAAVFKPEAEKVNEITEKIEVNQGKLVLGFRVNMKPDDKMTSAMRSFTDVFGGGPYSKLFTNVREKMSLCYYCSARYVRKKSYIVVQCGCEEENMDKAVNEILNQLGEIKKGNFDYELASSKAALADSINSVNDAPETLEAWYSIQLGDDEFKTPAQSAAENNGVTKEQIIECSRLVSLDTVYKLVSLGEGE